MTEEESPTTQPSTDPDDEQMRLPPAWEKKVNESGEIYYADHDTRTTSWEPPPVQRDLGPLPSGWVLERNPRGVAYFIDHNTKTTTFTDPRARQGSV